MAINPVSDKKIPSPQLSFAGGINTSLPFSRIRDNEAVDLINFRFDDESSLIPRQGTTVLLDRISAATINNRITSVYSMRYQNGTIRDFLTTGTTIRLTNGTDITGGLTLPNNVFWQWKSYGDLAIGVNRATGANANPVKVSSAGNAAALLGSPPKAKFIEVWNDRVWLSGAVAGDENVVFGSALGNPEDWTTAGAAGTVAINVEPDDNDRITGLCAFRERLFVFKKKRIYTIQAIAGAPPTDGTALSVELYAQNIGCWSGYSIQPILDDVLFYTKGGIASLVASERVGDFSAALLSRNVKEIGKIIAAETEELEISSMVIPEHNQYWLMVPQARLVLADGLAKFPQSFFNNDVSFVLDYNRITQGQIRISRYVGAAGCLVGCRYLNASTSKYLIAGRINGAATTYRLWTYDVDLDSIHNDNEAGTDAEVAVNQIIVTKNFDFSLPFNRKELLRQAHDFIGINAGDDADILISYYLDGNPAKLASWTMTILNADLASGITEFKGQRKFKRGSRGKRAKNLQFVYSNNTIDQSFGLKSLTVWYSVLPEKFRDGI